MYTYLCPVWWTRSLERLQVYEKLQCRWGRARPGLYKCCWLKGTQEYTEGAKGRAGTQVVAVTFRSLVHIPYGVADDRVQCSFYFNPTNPHSQHTLMSTQGWNEEMRKCSRAIPKVTDAVSRSDFQPQCEEKTEWQREDKISISHQSAFRQLRRFLWAFLLCVFMAILNGIINTNYFIQKS